MLEKIVQLNEEVIKGRLKGEDSQRAAGDRGREVDLSGLIQA